MQRLTREQLENRLRFDYQVFQRMQGTVFTGAAYRSRADLDSQKNPIPSPDQGHLATKYRIDFHVKTPTGRGQFADLTTIGFDLEVDNYPITEPATWIISRHVPYSPHFRQGAPVCIGEIWGASHGELLLGQLLVHIAKLLNWDEVGRGGGYVGWNGDAIQYHKEAFKGRPITEGLLYPLVPTEFYGVDATQLQQAANATLFRPIGFADEQAGQAAPGQGALFRPIGPTGGDTEPPAIPLFKPIGPEQ